MDDENGVVGMVNGDGVNEGTEGKLVYGENGLSILV